MNGCFLFGKDLTLKENEKRRPLPLEPSPSGSWDNGKADNSLQFQSQAKLNTFYFSSLQFSQNLTPMKRKLQAGLFLNLLCPMMPVGSNLLALLKENPNNPIRRLVAVPCKHIADDIEDESSDHNGSWWWTSNGTSNGQNNGTDQSPAAGSSQIHSRQKCSQASPTTNPVKLETTMDVDKKNCPLKDRRGLSSSFPTQNIAMQETRGLSGSTV